MGLAGGKALPRRTILVGAGALVLPAMSGCGSLAPENIQARHQIEKSLKSFPAVKSVDVRLDSNFTAGDSWSVLILLNKNPGREETLTVLKDAYDRVVQVVGDDFASVTASWVQNGASVSWPISANEPNGAELDYLRELAKPGRGAMSAGRGRISVDRGVVKEFPADLIVAPRSGVSVSDSFELDGMSIRAVSDTVDLSPIPLRKVVEAIDSKYREGAVVELTDNDIVSGSISLDVAAFGKESDGLDDPDDVRDIVEAIEEFNGPDGTGPKSMAEQERLEKKFITTVLARIALAEGEEDVANVPESTTSDAA